MVRLPIRRFVAATFASVIVGVACAGDGPTADSSAAMHSHDDPLLAVTAPAEVRQKIAELRQWSAKFHDLDKAAAAGYSVNIGCIDETVAGVDPSVARGMGYHVTKPGLIEDGMVDIDHPELLVYAPHPRDASLPKAERLGKARLIGFDYYLPDPDRLLDPPEFFGEPFNYSEPFAGWVRHIYLWGHNPEGMFEDYNQAVPLCTELLSP
jgi:hypothetical protein